MKVWGQKDFVAFPDLNANFAEVSALATAGSPNPTPTTIKVGAQGWLEAVIGGTESGATSTSLSQHGGVAMVAATRTSDDHNPGLGQGAFAAGLFVLNDNPDPVGKQSWGAYVEVRRIGSIVGTTIGMEICPINGGANVIADPYTYEPQGLTVGFLMDSGRPDVIGGSANICAGIIFGGQQSGGGPQFNAGIIFAHGGLAPRTGTYTSPIAIDMSPPDSIVWRDRSTGNVRAWIRSDVNYATEGGSLVFTAASGAPGSVGGLVLRSTAGAGMTIDGTAIQLAGNVTCVNALSVSGPLVVTGGEQVAVVGMPLAANDAAAATVSIPIDGVYINSSTGAMTVRRS